ncbi:MAG TPA: hypothetical protein VF623_05950 [Segetibacter sp.]|jgi:hypothetical protein
MQILAFITSVQTEEDQQLVVSTLTPMKGMQKVGFDKVNGKDILRVEVDEGCPFSIERTLISKGFICVEMH